MNYSDATIIIPTLNEANSIGELLKVLTRSYKKAKMIVADDCSTDRTQQTVRRIAAKNKNVKLLDRRGNATGLTASVLDAAIMAKTKFIVVIDGDLQHPPEKIAEIVAKLRKGKQVVIGERKKVEGNWPVERRIMSILATTLARLRLMRRIRDPMSGFFGAETSYFNHAVSRNIRRFELGGYKVLFDLLKCSNPVTGTVWYTFYQRKGGKSKIRTKHAILFARSLFR